jgi:chaperonin GroEL
MNPDQNTKILFGDKAIFKLMEGVDLVCDATSTTLGPRGRNVAIDKEYQILVIHDGVKTSLEVNPKDPFQKLGAKIIKEAAKKQRDSVGDGTTLVLVLAQAILKESLKAVASGINPMSLRKGLEEGSKKLVEKLKGLSIQIKTLSQKINIATVSSEDLVLGKMIAETIHKIGNDGIITADKTKQAETTIEMQEGMQIDKGYAHQFMITEPETMRSILEDVHILITDKPITSILEIGKFLEEKVLKEGVRKMVFIAPEIGGDFLSALLGAKVKGEFIGLAVKAPMVGSHQIESLQDMCAMTGAKFISNEAGNKFEDIDLSWCGKIKRIVSSKFNTIITGPGGFKDDVLQRIQIIKKQMEDETVSDWDREKLRERLGKLTNGIAVVKVGGETEVEINEKYERVDDAIKATQAAIKSGIIPGGETIFLRISDVLDAGNLGQKILYDALFEPFKKLVENAGFDGGEMLNELKHRDNQGLDIIDGVWKDMIKAGIIDPMEVAEVAIKTAVSVAVQIISIGAAIVPDKDEMSNMSKK